MLLNVYCTHRAPPPLDFPHVLRSRRDTSDPELLPHLGGFAQALRGGGTRPMTATLYALLRHVFRVKHQLALEVEDADLAAFGRWAAAANGIVFAPDGVVRSPSGQQLADLDGGGPEPGAVVPFPVDAEARKARSHAALGARGIHIVSTLPPVVGEVEVVLRPAAAVASRCLALFACAVRAESLRSAEPIPAYEIGKRMPAALAAMTHDERAFLSTQRPEPQAITDKLWRYEALATLAWSIGLLDELPPATELCDVPAVSAAILAKNDGADNFLARAHLRPTAELLDLLDLTFREHWAVVDALTKQAPRPGGLEPGVVQERHYALNWLTSFEDAPWDEVTTPT